jgi:hypothetical protein
MTLVADELHRRVAADKSGRFEQSVARAIARLPGMTRQKPKSRPIRKQEPPSILDGKRNAGPELSRTQVAKSACR